MKTISELNALVTREGYAAHPALASQLALPWFVPPRIDTLVRLSEQAPRYTAVIPIFNQEAIIGRFLNAHFAHATQPHDMIAIFDCCSDQSLAAFIQAIESHNRGLLCNLLTVSTSVPYFETACDNLGFVLTDTADIIEHQPDLTILTAGYDVRLLSALHAPGVFAVSGRCGHSLRDAYRRARWPYSIVARRAARQARVGLCDQSIETDGELVDDSTLEGFLCETVNRGPYALRRADLVRLGFLDQANFCQGGCDHDLNLRAYLAYGLLPAYVPLRIRSQLNEGSTRKPRDELNARVYAGLMARPNTSTLKRFQPFYRPYCPPTPFSFKVNPS